jgi:hypothetical protein
MSMFAATKTTAPTNMSKGDHLHWGGSLGGISPDIGADQLVGNPFPSYGRPGHSGPVRMREVVPSTRLRAFHEPAVAHEVRS